MKRILVLAAALLLFTQASATACCYLNKDVHNNTGQPVWDIKMVFDGAPDVVSHYDGYADDWRFRQFSTWKANGRTYLRWFDPVDPAGNPAPIPFCTFVHIGYRLTGPATLIHAWWTDEAGCPLPNGHIQQPSHWVYYVNFPARAVVLKLVNDAVGIPNLQVCVPRCPDPTVLRNVFFAVLPEELPLADLNPRNTMLQSMLQPLPGGMGPFVLDAAGELVELEIPVPIQPGQTLVYRLEGEGLNEFVDFGQHEMMTPTALDHPSGLELNKLYQSEPNPSSQSAKIRYRLTDAGPVLLRVFDADGRLVRTLVDARQVPVESGHEVVWDGANDAGHTVGSGTYFYQLQAPGFAASRKLVVIK